MSDGYQCDSRVNQAGYQCNTYPIHTPHTPYTVCTGTRTQLSLSHYSLSSYSDKRNTGIRLVFVQRITAEITRQISVD